MIIYTTCATCGGQLELAPDHRFTHPDCPPSYLDQLADAFMAAVTAGDHGTADALALTLDSANSSTQGLLEAACAYALAGWPVFPCRAGDKVPATRHGFHDATTDTGRITRWWTRHPDHNIGVATGHGFDVIDIDYASSPQALDWWITTKENSDLEIDAIATTPRGVHAYVLPTGAGPASKLFDIAGVDYRGIGGYIVMPPSRREDGTYTWWVLPSPRIWRM